MRTASAIARYLAGMIFLVFGLNGFLNFIPLPPPGGIAGQFMGAMYASHYLWVIFGFQVIAAVLLLINRYLPLAVAVLAPVIVNIISFHALMSPSGLPLALFVAVLWVVIFVDVRPAFAGLFQAHPKAGALDGRHRGAPGVTTASDTFDTGSRDRHRPRPWPLRFQEVTESPELVSVLPIMRSAALFASYEMKPSRCSHA